MKQLFLVLAVAASSPLVCAQGLVATFPFGGAKFAAHPSAALMYVSVPSQNAVAVIDTETLAQVDSIWVGSNPRGLCLSPSGERLFVCTSGAQALAVVDTHTRTLLPSIPLPYLPFDVEAGTNDRVFVTPNGPGYHGIMQVDTAAGTLISEFELGVFVYYGGMVEISPDRQRLYFGNAGLSPGTLACYDVSSTTPTLVWANAHGALGSNGQCLGLSADGAYVSYACGSGNFGYDIFKISTSSFLSVGSFLTGPYPRDVVYAPDGAHVYTVHTSGQIDRWNANTYLGLSPIPTAGQPDELAVDRSGRYLFAGFASETRVYSTGFGLGSSTAFCPGDGSVSACPCSNFGAAGHGCENSAQTGGALLASSGVASLSADTLALLATGLPTQSSLCLFVQGELLTANGSGILAADGLRCVGGTIRRLGGSASPSGQASYPGPSDLPVSVRGAVPPLAGTTRYYQVAYRDTAPFCTAGTFNWSSALGVAWAP